MKTKNVSSANNRKTALRLLVLNALLFSMAACSSSSDTGAIRPANTNGSNAGSSDTSSVSTATTPTSTSPDTQKEPTLVEKIKALEDSGAYPKLDRSSDIKGPDANNNGVRDDIDAWIAALPITEVQKKAAMQKADILQKTLLVDLNDKVALQVVGDGLAASTKCLGDAFEPKREESYKLSSKIEAMTANTKERATRYMQYNRARSGSSTPSPKDNYCK